MSELRTVRKHSNRRLWYPDGRRYVTLADIHEWVVGGTDLNVIDIDTGADVTRDVLFQVMAAQQTAALSMTREFLLQAIRTGARPSGGMAATFLEQSMNLFSILQRDRKNRGSAAQNSPMQTAERLAQANYQRWCAVQGRISRTLANGGSVYSSSAVGPRTEMIASPFAREPARRSKRSPRPPAARAGR